LNVDSQLVQQMQTRVRDRLPFATFEEAAAALLFSERWETSARDDYAREAFVRTPDGRVEWRNSQAGVIATYGAAAASLWVRIDVRCPTLVVRGYDSPFFLESDMQPLQTAIPGAHGVVIPDTGQLLMQDDPASFAGHLDAFVRELL
jgi:pimeloyl-ACP methyl ester carboxylesterase